MAQATALTHLALRSIRVRLGTASLVLFASGCLVIALCFAISIVDSLGGAIQKTGSPQRALVLRGGSDLEVTSQLHRDAQLIVLRAPGIQHDTNNVAAVSSEVVVGQNLERGGGDPISVQIRGVGPAIRSVRPEAQLVTGRFFTPGVNELIVGKKLSETIPELELGKDFMIRGSAWRVVGVFSAAQSMHESEIWADTATLLSTLQWAQIGSITARLSDARQFDEFKRIVEATSNLEVRREDAYYEAQAGMATRLLSLTAYVVGALISIAALLAAMNAINAAVRSRSTEIATLRTLGFEDVAVVIAVLNESVILTAIGAIVGVLLAVVLFDGDVFNTVVGRLPPTRMAFALDVSPQTAALAAAVAVFCGAIGSIPAALGAVRINLAQAVRSSA